MRLKISLGLAVAMILGGCSTTPQEIDSYPVHASFSVNEPLGDLYYRLTATPVSDGVCSQILNSYIYQDRGEFRIYYGAIVGSIAGSTIFLNNAVYAKQQGSATSVDVRKTTSAVGHEKSTAKLINFIKTGSCK